MNDIAALQPTRLVGVRETFGIDADLQVPAFAERDAHVPEIDAVYRFNPDVTLAILAGFMRDRRVMVQGLHGTGKSTHIEQVAARLNWPCVRLNLDGHISRLDLVGKDAVVLRDGKQVTEFQEGMVPWALQRPVALIFDEYDAGRPDVMFVIQRILERDGQFTLLDQNKVLRPHPFFRLFATANTVGLGNLNGLYHGAQRSTMRRSTAGTSSPRSTTCPWPRRSRSCRRACPRWPTRRAAPRSRRWWRWPTSRARASRPATCRR